MDKKRISKLKVLTELTRFVTIKSKSGIHVSSGKFLEMLSVTKPIYGWETTLDSGKTIMIHSISYK